jgi:MFS family permease
MWYKRSEQPLRMGIWYLSTGLGQILGALASYGFQFYDGKTFKSWQIMFLLFGLITIVIGVITVRSLPSSPMMASFLTHTEKVWVIERVRENRTGIQNKHFKLRQVFECFRDPQAWLICLINILSNIPNGSVSTYQAAIIEGFGFSSKATALLSVASGAVAMVSTIGVAWFSGRFNAIGVGIIFLVACGGVLGGGLVAFSPNDNQGLQLAGNFLTNFIGSSLVLLYAYSSSNFAGNTKKVTMNAMLLVSFGKPHTQYPGFRWQTQQLTCGCRHWKHHWSIDLPGSGCAEIRPGQDYDFGNEQRGVSSYSGSHGLLFL